MAFEKYEGQRPRTIEPIIGIRKNGQIVLNDVLARQYEVDINSFAYLHYDSEANQIGLQISNIKMKGARKLTKAPGCSLVSGIAFLKHFEIDHPTGKKYTPDSKDGMIIINLD